MRILIVSDTYPPHVNGAAYFSKRLAEYLSLRGHTVSAIVPSRTLHNAREQEGLVSLYRVTSLPVYFHEDFRFALTLGNTKFIKDAITAINPEIIHVQGHFFLSKAVMKIAKKRAIPIVGTNHFMPDNLTPYLPLPQSIKEQIHEYGWRDFATFFNMLDAITTPTETAANLIRNKVSQPVTSVSCGIDMIRFNPSHDTSKVRERYKLTTAPIVLYVGRLDKEKNIDLVIRAFATIATTPAQLVIAGIGSQESSLRALADELGIRDKVVFTGFVSNDDLPALYAASTLFVIAGTAELQSIVTMEAMASGLPVVGAAAVALPELVHHGKNGIAFEPGNVAELAQAMQKLLTDTDLYNAMRAESLAIIQKHEIGNSMEKFENIYKTVLTKKS